MQFAEFLNHSYPNRLGILYLPTCVGLGYGHRESSLAAFLDSTESVASAISAGITSQPWWGADLPTPRPTRLHQDYHRLATPIPLRPRFAGRSGVGRFLPLPKEWASP